MQLSAVNGDLTDVTIVTDLMQYKISSATYNHSVITLERQ